MLESPTGVAGSKDPAYMNSPGYMNSPTLSVQATLAGVILGTAAYMSPEQARGKTVDRRTDIWAFGCVLFEMLTGTRAFEGGETLSDAVAAILMREPDWNALPADVPPHIRTLMRRCLQKDPQRRIPHIGIARIEIDEPPAAAPVPTPAPAPVSAPVSATSGALAAAAPRAPRARTTALIATALASAAIAGGGAWMLTRPRPVAPPVIRLHATPAAETISVNTFDPDVAVSPDGTRIAYLARPGKTGSRQIYVRALQQGAGTALAGTEDARGLFFSPDGQWVGYTHNTADLKKMSVNGGPAVTVCQSCAGGFRGGTWGPDDSIVFSPTGGTVGLRRVPAAGGDVTVVEPPKNGNYVGPEFLPGGRAVLFSILTGGPDTAQVVVKNLDTGDQKVLVRGASHARYVATGHLVYGVAGTLRAIAFDPETLEVAGNPLPVLDGVVTKNSGIADFAVSRDGLLVYISGDVSGSGQGLTLVDRQGRQEPTGAPPRTYAMARFAPDGQRVAVEIRDQQNDIWIWDLARPTLTRLTFDAGVDRDPIWTPDGRRVVFSSVSGGAAPSLFWQSSGGTGSPERLTKSAVPQNPQAFTPDGEWLVAREDDLKTGMDLVVVSMEGERAVKPLIRTPFNEVNADLSPDGRWIAYQSNESGRDEVYVRPFPTVEDGRWQISTGGGTRPVWARNRRELFFVDAANRLVAVPVKIEGGFSAGSPTTIVEQIQSFGAGRSYDPSPDGTRFIVIGDTAPANPNAPPPQLNVVLNWGEELKRLVPVGK